MGSHTSITWAPWGIGEARFVLRGRELVYGVASSHVPGCSVTEKKDNLRKLNELQLQEMLTQHKAFRVALESGQALLMPPMHITIQACHSEEVAGVRWGVAAASELTGNRSDCMCRS